MNAAVYARDMSRGDYRDGPVEEQIEACLERARAEHLRVAHEHVYVEDRFAPWGEPHAALDRLLAAAKARAFSVVIVEDITRLSLEFHEIANWLERFYEEDVSLLLLRSGRDAWVECYREVKREIAALLDRRIAERVALTHLADCRKIGFVDFPRPAGAKTPIMEEGEDA